MKIFNRSLFTRRRHNMLSVYTSTLIPLGPYIIAVEPQQLSLKWLYFKFSNPSVFNTYKVVYKISVQNGFRCWLAVYNSYIAIIYRCMHYKWINYICPHILLLLIRPAYNMLCTYLNKAFLGETKDNIVGLLIIL